MMRKSVLEMPNVQISLMNMNGAQSNPFVDMPITTDWVDYVFEIPESHEIFNGMYVKFNAQAPTTECYIDEIFMDNNPNPRTLPSAVTAIENETVELMVVDGCISICDTTAPITVYNTMGQCVYKGLSPTIHLSKGLYVVVIAGVSHKVFVN